MLLTRWDPFATLARLDAEFDRLVRYAFGTVDDGYVPPVEVTTDGDDLLITMELPGVDPARIDVEVADGHLTVSGERQERSEHTRGRVLVKEIRHGAFRRSFRLPEGVTADQIDAEAGNGLLHLRIRNAATAVEAPRKIAVRPLGSSPAAEVTGSAED